LALYSQPVKFLNRMAKDGLLWFSLRSLLQVMVPLQEAGV
jgi:hypothetical protein